MNPVIMELPLQTDLMTTVRLTTGGVCSAAGLSLDDGEDCKVCVTESLLLLKHGGYLRAVLTFDCDDGIAVSVRGKDRTGETTSPAEDEISAALLCALAQNVNMEKRDGGLCEICFRFGLQA